MRMLENFKNPGDMSDSDELDELVDDVDEFGVPMVIAADHPSDDEDPVGEGDDDIILGGDYDDSDDSFDPDAEDSDDSMFDSDREDVRDTEVATTKPEALSRTQRNRAKANGDTTETDGPSGSREAAGGNSDGGGGDDEDAGGTVFDMNENDEDDDTVRAIIAAIKRPRSSPPEIKLDDFITDICFHPEQNIIALATITGDVCLYEYGNDGNKLLRTVEVHAKACRDVEFTEDGLNLLTCSKDKSIMVTDMKTEKLKKFYESAHDDAINKLHIIDENLFVTGDDAGTVKLWDLRTKDEVFALKEVEDYITQLLTNDAKKLLLVTSGDGYLTTINLAARKLFVQSEPYEEELTCMGVYRGDSKLVAGTSKGRLYTYNWGQFGYHCDMYPGINTPINEMIPVTDRIGCVAGEEGIIRACHIAPFRNLGIVGQHSMPVECLDISNTGELIASSSHNNDVRFWNVKYFEDFGDIKYNEKHNALKEKSHNLPSSKFSNASDFFADLAKAPTSDDGDDV